MRSSLLLSTALLGAKLPAVATLALVLGQWAVRADQRWEVTPAFFIQPSVQYIQDPGGTGDMDDAVAIGAWVGITF